MTKRTLIITLLSAAGIAGLTVAGPLNPPAGPVASTMKTLGEIEPRIPLTWETAPGDNTSAYKITNGGNYYLTGNVYAPPGYNGILINTSNVTIDFNGFAIYGVGNSHEGITAGGYALGGITVKNAYVTGLGQQAIDLINCTGCRVINVRTVNNAGNGIAVGANSTVTDCETSYGPQSGVVVGERSTVLRCRSNGNATGFSGTRSVFEGCTASENTVGISAGSGSTVRDCFVVQNTQQGIVVVDSATITGNQCRANGGTQYASIWAQGDGSTITGNQTSDSAYGVYAGGNHNTISGNTFNSPTQRAVAALGTNNLIIQNTLHSAPGGIQAVAFNRVGAILVAGYNPQLINGTTGGGLAITDPYANLLIN